jgi:hypothetical protein
MELDLQSLFELHVHSYTQWLRPRYPIPSRSIWAHIRGRYWSAKIGFVNCDPLIWPKNLLPDDLKVHKIENFFDSDFGICVISLIVM